MLAANARTRRKSEMTRATRTAMVPLTMTMAMATPYAVVQIYDIWDKLRYRGSS